MVKEAFEDLSSMTPEWVPITDLVNYGKNARVHPESQIDKLATSIKKIGLHNPIIIDENNIIIAGHARVVALKKLGWEHAPARRAKGLKKSEKQALAIADNKITTLASWDENLLKDEIKDILESDNTLLDATGFTYDDYLSLIEVEEFEPLESDEEAGSLSSVQQKKVKCPQCGHEFDSRDKSTQV